MTSHINLETRSSTLIIRMARGEAKNALSLNMYSELTSALVQLDQDSKLTSAIVYGSEQCFTSGNDLKDFLVGGELNRSHPTVQFLYQLVTTKKPIIAAVAGPAIGIGTTMLLHCDLVVAGDNSVFQLPFCRLGLCPEAASSLLLPNLVGHQKAFELLVLGEKFDVKASQSFGLVNKVVAPELVLANALEFAEQLAQMPLDAVVTSKRLMRTDKSKTQDLLALELAQFQRLMDSDEAKTIIGSFFNRK